MCGSYYTTYAGLNTWMWVPCILETITVDGLDITVDYEVLESGEPKFGSPMSEEFMLTSKNSAGMETDTVFILLPNSAGDTPVYRTGTAVPSVPANTGASQPESDRLTYEFLVNGTGSERITVEFSAFTIAPASHADALFDMSYEVKTSASVWLQDMQGFYVFPVWDIDSAMCKDFPASDPWVKGYLGKAYCQPVVSNLEDSTWSDTPEFGPNIVVKTKFEGLGKTEYQVAANGGFEKRSVSAETLAEITKPAMWVLIRGHVDDINECGYIGYGHPTALVATTKTIPCELAKE